MELCDSTAAFLLSFDMWQALSEHCYVFSLQMQISGGSSSWKIKSNIVNEIPTSYCDTVYVLQHKQLIHLALHLKSSFS